MTILQAIILGIIQGLTEFIPISSTAHLRIVPALLGWEDPGAAASAVIQLGTLVAVLIYFFNDIVAMTRAFFRGLVERKPFEDTDSRIAWLILIGTIPVGILGLAFKDFIEGSARNLWIVATFLIVVAVLLGVAEIYARKRADKEVSEVTLSDALVIGLLQCLALIPGSSRSGSTIMAGLFRGLTHSSAARFSFLLSIPAIGASGVFELVAEWNHLEELGWIPILVASLVSFASGWASIWFLLRFLRTHTTFVFVWYRIVLGIAMIALLLQGVLAPL